MALTVGVNSYISVADADTYFDDRLYVSDWIGATSGDKANALMMARRAIDRQAFVGSRTFSDQLLAWPRSGILDVDNATTPQAILDAQCELALAFLREDLTADDGTRGVRRLQAGSVAIEYDGRAPSRNLPDVVSAILAPYLLQSANPNSIAMVL